MSLLVTTVIHFSRDDLDLVELRLREAKSDALMRGVALLIIRDSQMPRQEDAELQGPLTYRYSIGGVAAQGSEIPSSGMLSLVSASAEELADLMQSVARVSPAEAQALAERYVAYREETLILDRSQLLAIPGLRKQIYDAIKPWVHALGAGTWLAERAPDELKSFLESAGVLTSGEGAQPQRDSASGEIVGDAGGVCTALTFECLDSQEGAGQSFRLFEVQLTFQDQDILTRRFWVAGSGVMPGVIEQSALYRSTSGAL